MPRVVHFEIHAEDPERGMQFYRSVLGWEFNKWSGPHDYWLISTGPQEQPGINGGLMRRKGPSKGEAIASFICTVDVPSVDEYSKRAVEAGGKMAMPKMSIPGVGWLVYCKDTEGNLFGMMQADKTAT